MIDAFRLREHEGPELGATALRAWLRDGGQPTRLLGLATQFRQHQGIRALRSALQILQ